jgi:hypothetical protein
VLNSRRGIKKADLVRALDFFASEPRKPKSAKEILAVFDYMHAVSKGKDQ